ncbi:MAG: helicase-related protein [Coprobacillus cateniformis]
MNLTSAQAVIHFDPWWNMSAKNQATDRAHRITKEMFKSFSLLEDSRRKDYGLQNQKKNLTDTFGIMKV